MSTLIPLGPLDRTATGAAVDRITPAGYTPISLALHTAADQLPADASPQAIVLVSDGEDTCDTPPCDTATHLKQTRPGLSISTVGFKVDGAASDQLRCIADVTGGLFVQAANADQLAARLLATQDLDTAVSSLSSTGMFGINLGTPAAEIRAKYHDFPDVAGAGSVTAVWRDCDFVFLDGTLDSIRPHDGGRTIDGLASGAPADRAGQLYGRPLAASSNPDGTTTVLFDADPGTEAAYQMIIESFTGAGGKALSGTIRTITLCLCKPRAKSDVPEPEQVLLRPVDAEGNTMPGYQKDLSLRTQTIDCNDARQSPYDVTDGVRFCGVSADSGDACWPTAGGSYVLCLQDPFSETLVLRAADGAAKPLDPRSEPPRPMALELEDGAQCRARNGGAWGFRQEHPDFVGQFLCKGGSSHGESIIAWSGPGDDYGITRGPDGWTVQTGTDTGPLTTRKVTKAYFVGVA